jgi:acylphosphatase
MILIGVKVISHYREFEMSAQICLHYYVSGKVQGVWFRASTKEQADQLGLTGWVRNLADGRVEVLACGDKDKIVKLSAWLKHGPRLAKVTNVTYEELFWQEWLGFEVL